MKRGAFESSAEGDHGLDVDVDVLGAVLADVAAEGVGFLLQPLVDLSLDLADAALEGLVLQVRLVAAVQSGAHGVVRALVLPAERQKPRESFLERFGQQLPSLVLRKGPGVCRQFCQQVLFEVSCRGQAVLDNECSQCLLEQPVQVTQPRVGRLAAEILQAGCLPQSRAPPDTHMLAKPTVGLFLGIQPELALHPGFGAPLPLGALLVLHVGAVLVGQAVGTQEEGQSGQHRALAAVVTACQNGGTADRDVYDVGQGAESARGVTVEIHGRSCSVSPRPERTEVWRAASAEADVACAAGTGRHIKCC